MRSTSDTGTTEREAATTHAREDRRRARRARWRQILGVAHATPPGSALPRPTIHEATTSFLDQAGAHDRTEDLHPSRLDPVQSDLDDALARASLEKTNAERDARDA